MIAQADEPDCAGFVVWRLCGVVVVFVAHTSVIVIIGGLIMVHG
jgi:hypothetical protein